MAVWSDNAIRILKERYLLRDEKGNVIETPEEMCARVARTMAKAEYRFNPYISQQDVDFYYREFYNMLSTQKFLPNSPCLANAGREPALQMSACFVIPVPDDIDGIFDALKAAAKIHKTGGGTGFAFSRLRPRGSRVKSTTNGIASGPVSFMRIFNEATEQVKQGGIRRGANMGVLRVDHSDIMEFIECKRTGGITNFNISVGMTDQFMELLRIHPEHPWVDRTVGEVWRAIVEAAWATGDPGLVFLDKINARPANPIPLLEQIETTNPCGEQALGPWDVCNLGHLNLGKFVHKGKINWIDLSATTANAVRFMDNLIEVNPYPLPEVEKRAKDLRRIGLGVMGWHDMLMKLDIPYASQEALNLARDVMGAISDDAAFASQGLAVFRGAFPLFNHSIYAGGVPRRNACLTTVAPTGTVSIIAGASAGIEPEFAMQFEHNNQQGRSMIVQNAVYAEAIADGHVLTAHEREVFATAHEIAPEWHVRMQAAFQQEVENSVSKTVNLPESATVEDVSAIYQLAYDLGCNGITIYRDKSKDAQVLNHMAASQATPETDDTSQICPECGDATLVRSEGCNHCVCGYSACDI